jgi:hypothetical protein
MDGATRLDQALDRRNAVLALLALHAESPLGASELAKQLGTYAQRGLIIGRHLAAHGLAEVRQVRGEGRRAAYKIALTPLGGKVAQRLEAIASLL